jgi:cytochrome c553
MAHCKIDGFLPFPPPTRGFPTMKSTLATAPRTAVAALLPLMLTLAATGGAVAQTGTPFKPDLARGQQLAATCMACHTADGTRGLPANPILQGQHPEYLVKQLQEYKSGKRKNAIMAGMAAGLSDDDMRHIAAFYASKKAPTGVARNKDTVLLGEQIWRGGIMAKGVPACAGCHSPNGAGIPAQYPRIGGQHAEYTEAQLLHFRSGERANNAQMSAIAAKMSDLEIKAVADYAAGLR